MDDNQGAATDLTFTISDTNPAASDAPAWMLNRLDGQNHPALNTDIKEVIWDNDRRAFSILDDSTILDKAAIYKEANTQKLAFISTVGSYNHVARQHGNLELDINADHTWDEVLAAQQGFSQAHEVETSKGLLGSFRKTMRRFGDNSESFQAWLKLLPTESHYISVLCGGLTLVLSAAHRMADLRESIRTFVEDLPNILSRVKDYSMAFDDSRAMHQCSADLYTALLSTLDLIVREYHKRVTRRFASAVFRQSISGKNIDEKIKNVKDCGARLAVQADINCYNRQKVMLTGAKNLTKMAIASRRNQDIGFNIMTHQNSSMYKEVHSVKNALNEILSVLKASPTHRINTMFRTGYLESETSTDGYSTPRSRSPSPNIVLEQQRSRQELEAILSKLSIDDQADVAAGDNSTLLKIIYTLSLPSQDRAVALITSPDLQSWVTSPSSCALLINGHMAYSEYEIRQSPLSYVCAKLADSVLSRTLPSLNDTNNSIFAVRWFCGQHTNMATDYDAHPPGMLNNLLAQLINQCLESSYPPLICDLSVQDSTLKLSDLCDLFVRLVEALPGGTILFCIVDGIPYYEDTDRQTECWEVFLNLINLARRKCDATNGLFKLLVTAPLRSHCVQELFTPAEVLDLNEYIPPNGGFRALQWELGLGRAIDG